MTNHSLNCHSQLLNLDLPVHVIPTTKLKIFYTILSTIPHIVQDITHACKRYLFISIILFDRNKTQPQTMKTSEQRLAYH